MYFDIFQIFDCFTFWIKGNLAYVKLILNITNAIGEAKVYLSRES